MKSITFNQIVSAVGFSDLTTIRTDDVKTNISAFARWVFKGHPAWPFWDKQIKDSFKKHIVELYKYANNISSSTQLLERLYEISLKTIPDRHFSVSFSNHKRALDKEQRKSIKHKILSDLEANESVGHNLAKLNLSELKKLGINIYMREDLSNVGKAWLFVGEINQKIGVIACTNLTTINPTTKLFSKDQFNKISKMVKTVKKYSKNWLGVIIDLRDNTGGDSQFFEQIAGIINGGAAAPISKRLWVRNTSENIWLLEELQKRYNVLDIKKLEKLRAQKKLKILWYEGKKITIKKPYKQIRILTNRLVQSSSEAVIFQLGKCPAYKTVGENTGGCTIGFCPIGVMLPNGGIINMATSYSVSPMICKEGIGISPDIPITKKDTFTVALNDIEQKLKKAY